MVNTVKDRNLGRVRLFQMHWLGRSLALTSLPSRGGENWNVGLGIKVFSPLKRIENNCGYFLVLFLPLVQAENRTLCNNQRHKVYFFKEMFNANTSGQSFGFVSVPFLQPGEITWSLSLNQRHKRFSQQNMVSVLWLRKELCNSMLYFSSCNPLVTVCCSHYELMLHEIVHFFLILIFFYHRIFKLSMSAPYNFKAEKETS